MAEPEPEPEPVAEPEPPIYTGTTEPVTQVFTRHLPSFTPDAPPSGPRAAVRATATARLPREPAAGRPAAGRLFVVWLSSSGFSSADYSSSGWTRRRLPRRRARSNRRRCTTQPHRRPSRRAATEASSRCISWCVRPCWQCCWVSAIHRVRHQEGIRRCRSPHPGTDTTTKLSLNDRRSPRPRPTAPGHPRRRRIHRWRPARTGDATDGPLSFTVHGIEVGSTVVMSRCPRWRRPRWASTSSCT